MEFIILDNEWNTTYRKINGKCFNELIEIGAVKLDENLNEISRFSVLIRSTFTKKLSSRFQRLTNITTEEMKEKGMSFLEAVNLYSDWAGEDAVTLTWSNSDLYVLLENFRLRFGIDTVPFIGKYIDLQKYAQSEMILAGSKITSQISVANAAIMLGIPIDGIGLHRALDDSILSAECFKKVYNQSAFNEFVKNCDRDFYGRLLFHPYVIKSRNDPLIDSAQFNCFCDICGGKVETVKKWKFMNQSFRGIFYCKHCDREFKVSLRFKKFYDYIDIKRSYSEVIHSKENDKISE